jgi:RHS repeat-associated protein
MNRAAFIVCAWGLFVAGSAYAQTQQIGFPPYASLQHGEFDHVNLQNLNVAFSLPGVSVSGRGLSFSFAPAYNSVIWQHIFNGMTQQWAYLEPNGSNSAWGWVIVPSTGPAADVQSVTCDIDGQTTSFVSNYRFQEMNGTIHTFSAIYYYDPIDTACFQSGPRTSIADDGSGYYLDATVFGLEKVYSPSGTKVAREPRFGLMGLFDTNGNFISPSTTGDWFDTANRDVMKFVRPAGQYQYQHQDTTGTYQTITVNFQPFNIKTNFGCPGVAEDTQTASLPISIVYPNGQQYSFTYETTPGYPGYSTARLQRVTLPTGGYSEYDYTGPNDSINCADGTNTQMTRVVNDGSTSNSWQYSRAPSGSNWVTTVTAPQLPYDTAPNQTLYTFNAKGNEISQQIYQGSATGNPVRTINTSWTTPPPLNPITPTGRVTILEDGTTQSKTETTYDRWSGNLLSLKEYDWGAPGSLVRTTTWTYLNASPYTAANILDRVTNVTVTDNISSVVHSRTDIAYDESGYINYGTCHSGVPQHDDTHYPCSYTTRGKPTTVTTYTNAAAATGPIIHHTYYDNLGNAVKADVDCCQQKQWNFSATTAYSLPDSVVRGSSPGTQLTTSATYNSYTGLVATSTDENGKITQYTYDALKRLTNIQRPDGANLTWTYNDATPPTQSSVTASIPVQNSNVKKTTTTVDGLGRPIKQQLTDASGTSYSIVETRYDPLGRAYKSSNPHNSTAQYWTETDFDALGRSKKVILPDNSQTIYSYSLSTVTATDPTGKQKKTQADGLGRITTTYEPDVNNGNSLTQQTSYSYNVLDLLTTVTQGVQTRSYSYDDLGRVTSAQTPEANQAAASFQYNSSSLPAQRTDPRRVITTYGYDNLNRLTSVSYNVGSTGVPATASVGYTYDQGGAAANALGRLTSMTDGVGSESYTYDNLGRITGLQKVINGTTYPISYAYNLAGELTSITYPSNRIVQQSVDAIGRLCEIAPSTTGCGTASSPYATGYTYNVANQPTGFRYGNGIFASIGFSADRLQLNCLDYSTTNRSGVCAHDGTTKFGLTYSYGASGSNNGQISGITDSVDNGRNATYTFDALYRLTRAVTTGSTGYPAWGLSETYDRYGNRSAQSIYSGCVPPMTCPTNSVTPDTATNRVSGDCYDSNGNLLAESAPPCPSPTYTYDAENRMVNYSSAAYAYDGNGVRVVKSSGGTTTVYILSGSKVIAEYDNGAAVGSPSREYIYSGAQLLAKIDSSGTKYYHRDHLSNRLVTDSGGNTFAQMGHFPFGESWYNASNDKLLFTTYERDSESSNDYAMMRYSINRLGRFSTPDPLAGNVTNPQSLNRFAYTLNDALNKVDPLGLDVCGGHECIAMEDMNMSLRGRVGQSCNLDGMRTSCSLVLDLLQTGAGAQCPSNICFGVNGDNLPVRYVATMEGGYYSCAVNGEWASQQAAGQAAVNCANGRSIAMNRELGGVIYQIDSNGKYSFTISDPGSAKIVSVDFTDIPDSTEFAGYYHTHGAFDLCCFNEQFSGGDFSIAVSFENNFFPTYLGTPAGRILMLDPAQVVTLPEGCVLVGSGVPVGPGISTVPIPVCH